MDSDPGCDLIRNLKSDSGNILSQFIWVFLKNCIEGFSVFLINFRSQIQGNPIFLQKDHRFAHLCFLRDLSGNLPCLFFTDPFNLCQTFRFFLHDPDRICPELAHDPGCQSCSDPFDRAGTQIAFHGLCVLRHFFHKRRNLKLFAVHRMMRIDSRSLDRCSLRDRGKTSHASQLLLFFCLF